mmetsp:Transcript_7386/g.6621  ORF Transcript_7386/g.6621 Transcript_7386/m.6621 type:complete len:119 (-) Transcript_7386:81-437(-)
MAAKGAMTHKLSQRYDMTSLRAVEKIDSEVWESLAKIYGVSDPYDVPLNIDILDIYNSPRETRRQILVDLFKDVPGDVTGIIDKAVEDMEKLDSVEQGKFLLNNTKSNPDSANETEEI